jgi:hypothetical protein
MKEYKITNQCCIQKPSKANDNTNHLEKLEEKPIQERKTKEQSVFSENNNKNSHQKSSRAEKPQDINLGKKQKDTIIETSVRYYSMDDNDEFDNLFNDDNDKNDFLLEPILNKQNQENNNSDSENNFFSNKNNNYNKEPNINDKEFLDLKPKNSMKIKLNFDLNTVELNCKFVEINPDNQNNEFAEEDDELNYFDEFEEEKNEENYENEEESLGDNMEIEDNYYEGYDEKNEHNCVVREKSTIITIPNLNFLSEQNLDDAEAGKPRVENGYIGQKLRDENAQNLERVSKIGNSNENLNRHSSNNLILNNFTIFFIFSNKI